jgi:hypothetical protein
MPIDKVLLQSFLNQTQMKVILIFLFSCPFLLFSQFCPSYKLGLKYYEKGKYDKALNCLYRAEDNIPNELMYDLYKLIMEINLIKTNEDTYKRSEEIAQAHNYLKRLEKKNKLSHSQLAEFNKMIIDSSAHYLIQLCSIKRKHLRLATTVQTMKTNEFHEFSHLLYSTILKRELTLVDFSDFVEGYKNLYNSGIIINQCTEQIITKESDRIFHMIADSKHKSILGNLMGIEAFENSFMNSLRIEVTEKIKPYTDTIDMFGWDVHYTHGIWDFAKSYYDLHPSLVDQNIMKKLVIGRLLTVRKLSGREIENGCYTDEKMCFDQSPVTVIVKVMDSLIIRSYTINDQLSTQIFNEILRDSYLKYDQRVLANLIKDNELLFKNRTDEIKEIINEWIQIDYTGIIEFLRYHNKFGELESSVFLDFFKELANEYIHGIALSDKEYATNALIDLAITFPYDSYESHCNWFLEHFKNKLKAQNTKSMGKEMMALNHVFESNKEIVDLKRDFMMLDYNISHDASSMTVEELQWTGDHNNCDPGSLGQIYYDKMLERINFFRRWVGVNDDISFKEEYNEQAQHAALMMSVRGSLSHHPKKSWQCYTDLGYQGASHGNLFLGSFLSSSIDGYIDDSGQHPAGHRQWILSPTANHMGSGSVPFNNGHLGYAGSNCLLVITEDRNYHFKNLHKDSPVLWPPEGYVPIEFIELLDVWTFTMEDANFDNIAVNVTINGKEVPVKLYKNNQGSYGGASYFSMQFDREELTKDMNNQGLQLTTLYAPFNAGDVIKVFVKNVILQNGQSKDFEYEVLPFNPNPEKKTYVLSRN